MSRAVDAPQTSTDSGQSASRLVRATRRVDKRASSAKDDEKVPSRVRSSVDAAELKTDATPLFALYNSIHLIGTLLRIPRRVRAAVRCQRSCISTCLGERLTFDVKLVSPPSGSLCRLAG